VLLTCPIVQAPLAGGPSTPALAGAVSEAGGLGFIAAGYLTPEDVRAQIDEVRRLTSAPFGVNVFSPPATEADAEVVQRYAERIAPLAAAEGVSLGEPRFDDDHYEAKLALLLETRPAVVSFTFGCPTAEVVAALKTAGVEVWVTVTDADEGELAAATGADAVVAQGAEAGGHRGSFVDNDNEPLPLMQLIEETRERLRAGGATTKIVAAGGLMTGADIAAVLEAGASAAQLGTAFLLCPEAGTNPAYREALMTGSATTLTRAFTGRRARGLINAWTERIGDDAPSAYPQINHLTSPLRAHGRKTNNTDLFNLWAGERHHLARALPAAELIAQLRDDLPTTTGRRPRGDTALT
jgi:nitronate monooxygenase